MEKKREAIEGNIHPRFKLEEADCIVEAIVEKPQKDKVTYRNHTSAGRNVLRGSMYFAFVCDCVRDGERERIR